MFNIHDICGVQDVKSGNPIFAIRPMLNDNGFGFAIIKVQPGPATLTLEEATDKVLNMLDQACEHIPNDSLEIARAQNRIAKNTRRGQGSVYDRVITFKGTGKTGEFDAGLFLAHDIDTDLYAIVTPDGWDEYYILVES